MYQTKKKKVCRTKNTIYVIFNIAAYVIREKVRYYITNEKRHSINKNEKTSSSFDGQKNRKENQNKVLKSK